MRAFTDAMAELAFAIDAGRVWCRYNRWYERDAFQDDVPIWPTTAAGLQLRGAVVLVYSTEPDSPWSHVRLTPAGQDELDRWLARHGIGVD